MNREITMTLNDERFEALRKHYNCNLQEDIDDWEIELMLEWLIDEYC